MDDKKEEIDKIKELHRREISQSEGKINAIMVRKEEEHKKEMKSIEHEMRRVQAAY